MIEFDFFGIIIFLIVLSLEMYKFAKKKSSIYEFVFRMLFATYILLLIKVVFFPIPYTKKGIEVLRQQGLGDIQNFVPFKMIMNFVRNTSFGYALKQVGGNLILLFPLGIFVTMIFQNKKSKKFIFLVGLAATCFIEATQGVIGFILGFKYRVVDVDDIILNTVGYVLGMIVVVKIIQPLVERYLKSR